LGVVASAQVRGPTFRHWYRTLTVVRALVRMDLVTSVSALTPYVVVAGVAAMTGLILKNYLYRVEQDGLLVLSEPFGLPVYLGALLLSVFQAASVAIAVAREREQGAIELLFYGPVNSQAYMVAKLGTHILLYVWLTALVGFCDLLFVVVTGLPLSATVAWAFILSVGTAAAMISLALAVAAVIRRLRVAVLTVLGLATLSIGLQVLAEVLAHVPTPEFHVSPVQMVRVTAFALSTVTGWVLPFAYLDRGLSALLRGDPLSYLGTLGACGVYAMAMLGAAWIGLDRTGVRR
jgi:ABC-type transport system involved in multi-copper enzyme maturation permease subunit